MAIAVDVAAEIAEQSKTRPVLSVETACAFKFRTFRDVLLMPPKQFLVGGLIGKDDITALIGGSKLGKTLVALDVSACLIRGNVAFADRFDVGDPVTVCYMTGEGQSGFPNRTRGLHHKWNFIDEELERLIYCDRILSLCDAESPRAIKVFIQEFKSTYGSDRLKGGLLVIDTFARAMAGGDENGAKDTTIAQDAMGDVREQLGCSILVPSHSGYGAASDRIRGSSNLPAAFDGQIIVRSDGQGSYCMASGPSKDSGDFPDAPYRIMVHEFTDGMDETIHKGAYVEWLQCDSTTTNGKETAKERAARIISARLQDEATSEASAVTVETVFTEWVRGTPAKPTVRDILNELADNPATVFRAISKKVVGKDGKPNRGTWHYYAEVGN